jgi:small subunit ribosomal protein S30e
MIEPCTILMAHGGLAQAGKVKGQTPKVDKQVRAHKALTGRAHKRVQYNRMIEREHSGTRDGVNKQKPGKLGQ